MGRKRRWIPSSKENRVYGSVYFRWSKVCGDYRGDRINGLKDFFFLLKKQHKHVYSRNDLKNEKVA